MARWPLDRSRRSLRDGCCASRDARPLFLSGFLLVLVVHVHDSWATAYDGTPEAQMRPRSGCAPRYNADFLCMLETWEAGATFLPATAGKDRQAIDIARLPVMTSPKSGRDGRELHCAFSAPPDVRSPEATDSVRSFSHVDSDLEPYGRPLQHDHTSRSPADLRWR